MVSRPLDDSVKDADGSSVRVLLIDDEADTLLPNLAQRLESMGFEFHKESSAARALQSVESCNPDLILLDLHFPGDDRFGGQTTGGQLLTEIRQKFEATPVLVFTTRLDDVDIPLEAFDQQPHGYFAKPKFSGGHAWANELADAMHRAIDTALFSRNSDIDDMGFLVGQTKEMCEVVGQVRMAARNALNVLIYGETGTGKELAARAIHNLSGRSGRFEHLNCTGVDENTLESKLFGHVRGAFTDAKTAAEGMFELADGGTLFLDEIQRMPMALQDKLMLVVETGQIRRMGATNDKKVDVRLIVATNHSLSDLVADGVLREDLAQRFTYLLITLPPLRQRMADLPEFFKYFVAKASKELGKNVQNILRPETLLKLQGYDWPGNIRELETTITRAVAVTSSNIILPGDIQLTGIRSRSVDPTTRDKQKSEDSHSQPTTGLSGQDNSYSLTKTLTDELESLSIEQRYPFLLGQQDSDLRKAILTEFICRIRQQTSQTVRHKFLASQLDPLTNGEKDFEKIRQFVCKTLKPVTLTKMEYNS